MVSKKTISLVFFSFMKMGEKHSLFIFLIKNIPSLYGIFYYLKIFKTTVEINSFVRYRQTGIDPSIAAPQKARRQIPIKNHVFFHENN